MGHSYTNILLHVIFGTKERTARIEEFFRERLYKYMGGVARQEFGRALKIGGTADHIHALLSMRSDISAAQALCKFKSLSSGWVHKTFPKSSSFDWQDGYAAFSVSQSNVSRVIRYIENQESHHKKQSFEEELRALLEKHGIKYNPRDIKQ